MGKPEDVSQEAFKAAWKCAETVLRNLPDDYGDISLEIETIARAIMAAEQRAEAREREACAKLLEEGYDRIPGKSYQDDGVYSKNDTCAHDTYMWQDCEPCAVAAIRKRGKP